MRDLRFTFVCSADERKMLEMLASRQQRTKSDAVRVLVRKAFQACKLEDNRLRSDGFGDEKEDGTRS